MTKIKYYKVVHPDSIILFYHDEEKNKLDGMVEEYKKNNKLIIQKHSCVSCYNDVFNNSLANSMLKEAEEISKKEYDTAYGIVESMINPNFWYIATNKPTEKKEVVTETVIV